MASVGNARRRSSRRARRLRWTVLFLVAGALLGSGATAWIYKATRPEPYRPGEADGDITRALDRELPADAPPPRFIDVTDAAGLGGFKHFSGTRTSQLPEDMGSGAAWGDYDGDGDDDLFLVASGGALDLAAERRARSELYENRGDGTFARVESFPETRIIGMGAAWGDYDGDGRLDLAVSGYRSLTLYHNTESGFRREARFAAPDGFWAGLAWGDYDRDGDLDLYVCGYVRYVEADADRARATMQYGRSVPYTLNPASYKPERNLLYRNDGGGTLTEVAAELGVDNLKGRSLGALWHDFDEDGWIDLYVANDISDNVLYRNAGGRFEEISHAAWVADYRGAMGLAAGDWNRDGDDDLFITHWIAQENALYDSLLSQREGATDGAGELRFMDVADQRGLGQIALRLVGWGAEFADVDADAWLDLVVANGSTFEERGSPPRLQPQLPLLLWNRRGEYFHDLAPASEALSVARVSRGLALADYDQDGDVDLLFVDHGSGVRLLRNDIAGGAWLELRLRDRRPGAATAHGFGYGARLILHSGGVALRRTVGSASYLSQSSRTVHFGLGDTDEVERLEVRWPDGSTSVHTGLAAGALWEVTQGDAEPRRLSVASPTVAAPSSALDEDGRQRLVRFWSLQRAAMQAVKVDEDPVRAIPLFEQVLAIDPTHEDSLYYLAHSLAATGDLDGALERLEQLVQINPQSHRGLIRRGALLALHATGDEDLARAAETLDRALAINPEETGALLLLGEIALLRGEAEAARRNLAWACRSNPRAVGGFFLRGYLAWADGDAGSATELLERARAARGEDWKPAGTTAEGDVRNKMHEEVSPLSRFWESWDGSLDPAAAFRELDDRLARG